MVEDFSSMVPVPDEERHRELRQKKERGKGREGAREAGRRDLEVLVMVDGEARWWGSMRLGSL